MGELVPTSESQLLTEAPLSAVSSCENVFWPPIDSVEVRSTKFLTLDPVPPLEMLSTPESTISPEAGEEGVRPVPPPLKDITAAEAVTLSAILE